MGDSVHGAHLHTTTSRSTTKVGERCRLAQIIFCEQALGAGTDRAATPGGGQLSGPASRSAVLTRPRPVGVITRSAYATSFSLVHSSVHSRTEAELPALAKAGSLVSFDFSDEEEFRTPAYLDRVCPHVDLALLSCSHLEEAATRGLPARRCGGGPEWRWPPGVSTGRSPTTAGPRPPHRRVPRTPMQSAAERDGLAVGRADPASGAQGCR